MLNLNQARLSYDEKGDFRNSGFAEYSPAYIINNEYVYDVLQYMKPTENTRVLTVTGSGDQPLLYGAMGAKTIDTFDISYCAKVMYDIKNAAIRSKMSYVDLTELLSCLQVMPKRASDVLDEFKLSNKIPSDTMRFIRAMYGCKIFRRTGNIYSGCLPSADVYKDMITHVNDARFIWSDLQDLQQHLNTQYDQIYLSNILSYNTRYGYVTALMKNLKPFIAPHGKVMLHAEFALNKNDTIATIMNGINSRVASWGKIEYINKVYKKSTGASLYAYILQRQK